MSSYYYLAYYDGDKHHTMQQRLDEAITRYLRKWGQRPTVALVNPEQLTTHDELTVRPSQVVAKNVVYVGTGDVDV